MSRWLRNLKDGFNVCAQDEEAECGFCCVAMVVNLVGDGSFPPTSTLIQTSSQLYKKTHDTGMRYDRSTKDRVGAVGAVATPVVDLMEEHGMLHHGGGTYVELLGELLRGWGVSCNVFTDDDKGMKSAIQHAAPGKPVIVLVNWKPVGFAGGHWVVVVKRHTRGWGASSDYTILDPAGSVETNRGSVEYNPKLYGNSGVFMGYYLTT